MIGTLLYILPFAIALGGTFFGYWLGHRDGVKVGKERADLERYVKGYQHAMGDIVRLISDQERRVRGQREAARQGLQ